MYPGEYRNKRVTTHIQTDLNNVVYPHIIIIVFLFYICHNIVDIYFNFPNVVLIYDATNTFWNLICLWSSFVDGLCILKSNNKIYHTTVCIKNIWIYYKLVLKLSPTATHQNCPKWSYTFWVLIINIFYIRSNVYTVT